jgi:hypothetical protein
MTTISSEADIYIRQEGSNLLYESDGLAPGTITAFPVSIENVGSSVIIPINVFFSTDITFTTNPNQYFIAATNGVAFDGLRHTITIDSVPNYPGFVRNGSDLANGKSRVYIANINIRAINGSTLLAGSGWLAQTYFGKGSINNYISDCSSNGPISTGSGGIVGSYCSINSGSVFIVRCFSLGEIGNTAGGICGKLENGNINIQNCYSSGLINEDAGGILAADSSGLLTTIQICYSRGNIMSRGGGIVGSGSVNGISVMNCYSSGEIDASTGAGGIFGLGALFTSRAIHCYSCGLSDVNQGGIFSGSSDDDAYGSDNFSEGNHVNDGVWNKEHAGIALQDMPIGTSLYSQVWCRTSVDAPLEISSIGYSPYTSEVNESYSQTIAQGGSSIPAVLPAGYTYSILAVFDDETDTEVPFTPGLSINASTGVITVSPTFPIGEYTLIIRDSINPYDISEFILTVNLVCYGPGTRVLVGESLTNQSELKDKYIDITDLRPGMLVKTYKSGYLPIAAVGEKVIRTGNTPRTTMWRIPATPSLGSELNITGGHSILIPNELQKRLPSELRTRLKFHNSRVLIEGCRRVLGETWPGAVPVPAGTPTKIYHIVLDGPIANYGIWVNDGWLSETIPAKLYRRFGFRDFGDPCQNA